MPATVRLIRYFDSSRGNRIGREGRLSGQPPIFDRETYLDIFSRADPEGDAWLTRFLDAAEDPRREPGQLLAEETPSHSAMASVARRPSGTAASVGALLLGEAARALEQAAPRQEMAALGTRHRNLTQELAETRLRTSHSHPIVKRADLMTADGPSLVRILLLEDESFIRETIRLMLRTFDNIALREGADGTQGFKLLNNGFHPDIALCDVHMAPMDGLILCGNCGRLTIRCWPPCRSSCSGRRPMRIQYIRLTS